MNETSHNTEDVIVRQRDFLNNNNFNLSVVYKVDTTRELSVDCQTIFTNISFYKVVHVFGLLYLPDQIRSNHTKQIKRHCVSVLCSRFLQKHENTFITRRIYGETEIQMHICVVLVLVTGQITQRKTY